MVLKGYNYGEADRILTLWTPNAGKLRVVAKGMRKTKSRMGGHLDLFTRSSLLLARGRQLDIVTQAETLESFASMRTDLNRLSYAHYVAEILDNFTAEGLSNYPLYTLTLTTLRRLAEAANLELVVRAFELQLLALTGYRPQLYRCLNCDAEIQPVVNYFSAKMGGVLCPNCSQLDTAAPAISVDCLKALRNLQTSEEQMLRLPALREEVGRELEQRLHEYVTYRMESRPKSMKFLETLRTENATQ